MGCFDLKSGEGLVENEKQLLIMLVFSTFMGGAFGLIFGLLDVEDATAGGLRTALMNEESKCLPLGAGLGAIAAFLNEKVSQRTRNAGYERVPPPGSAL